MKKTLVALAALAATGAFAQSSVTIYGAVDASYNYASADLATGNQSKSFLGSSQLGSSKLGFKGVEDMGGGLQAVFKLEMGLNNDSGAGKGINTNNQATGATAAGALAFNRYSYVGLAGGFGEVHLGREYNYAFWYGQMVADPFGTNGPADSTQMALRLGTYEGKGLAGLNAGNMVSYITPNMGGILAGGQIFMGGNTSGSATVGSDDGNGYSVFANYTQGPIMASIATSVTRYATGDYQLSAGGASYDFGAAKVSYSYTHESVGSAVEQTNNSHQLGLAVPMGAATLKASYIASTRNAGNGDVGGDLIGLGVDYHLSKRTIAYVTYANVKNRDGGNSYSTGGVGTMAADGTSNNVAVGIYHMF